MKNMNKDLQLITEFKAIDNNGNNPTSMLRIEGLASTSRVDSDGDIILPSAWDLGVYKKNPILLSQHEHGEPIGKVTSIEVVPNGLHIIAEVSTTAEKVQTLIKEGVLKTFSVGFRLVEGTVSETTDNFTITKAILHEISIVSVPANEDAVFSIAKSLGSTLAYLELKKQFEVPASSIQAQITLEEKMDKEIKKSAVEVTTGAENLLKEVARRLEAVEAREQAQLDAEATKAAKAKEAHVAALSAENESMLKSLEDLKSELADKAGEIKAINESKMAFMDKGAAGTISDADIDSAVLLAKSLGRSIDDTAFGKKLAEKAAAGPHISTMLAGWEEQYNTRVYDDIKNRLVVEPLFSSITMSQPTMYLPINPEAGVASWVDPANYGSATGASSGTAATHALTENTLKSYKLASKEYISDEEVEDSIISLMPIIRDAVVRRMANASDIALLRGQATGATDPIAGLTKIAATDLNVLAAADQPSIGAATKVTVATLSALRAKLGVWGLSPADVVYIVSPDAYYDLLVDPDFRTMDLVGVNATILTGQIGSVNGSPVVVSTSYEAKAATKVFATAVNKSNFMVGVHRGLVTERERLIEYQRTVLVSTRRMGFLQTIAGNAVATGSYKV